MIVPFVMAAIFVMTLTMIAIPVAPTMLVVATIAVAMLAVSALVLESRHVFIVVPVIAYEVDAPAAGIVLSTMLIPVPLVTRRHVQVNRRGHKEFRRLSDHDWL